MRGAHGPAHTWTHARAHTTGSLFWEIMDLEAMLKFTSDTTGDVCNHARRSLLVCVCM